MKIEDTLPEGLEYVENSVKAEGSKPDPVELKFENGKVMAKYPEITDTEERSITFKVKVKDEVKVGKKSSIKQLLMIRKMSQKHRRQKLLHSIKMEKWKRRKR